MGSRLISLLKNRGVAAIVAKIASAALSFGFLWLIARLLSVREAGVFIYSYTLMLVVVQMSRAGTDHSLMKLLAIHGGVVRIRGVIFCTAALSMIFCLFLMGVVCFYNLLFPMAVLTEEMQWVFLGVALMVTACQIFSSYFQYQREIYSQYWGLNVGMVACGGLFCVVGATAQDGPRSAVGLGVLFLCGNIVVLLSCLGLFHRSLKRAPSLQIDDQPMPWPVADILHMTRPFVLVTFCAIATTWGAQVIAGAWLSEGELAVLSLSMRVAYLINFIHVAFSALLQPRIARANYEGTLTDLEAELDIYSAVSKIYSLVMLVIFAFAGHFLLGIFGEPYKDGYSVLVCMSMAWMLVSMCGQSSIILLLTGYARESLIFQIVASLVTVLGSALLFSWYGMLGGAIATALGSVLLPVICAVRVYRIHGLEFFSLNATRRQMSLLWRRIQTRRMCG